MTVITISRTLYSGGEQIAEEVAQRLGYPCLRRKELILGAAEYFHFEEAKLIEAMAEPPRLWQQDRDKRDAHFNLIRATFLRRCQEQKGLVYHGFSGQELIRNVPHVLRVLVLAEESYRLEMATGQSGKNPDQVLADIKASDRKFSKWTRLMYGFEWNNPTLYDLCFNIGRVSIDSAVNSLLNIIASGDFEPTEASIQRFNDELLASTVWSAITQNEDTSGAYVEASAKQGRVHLTGTVRSKKILEAINVLAADIDGVEELVNEMNIGTIWRS
jgi:cytidylate kinase